MVGTCHLSTSGGSDRMVDFKANMSSQDWPGSSKQHSQGRCVDQLREHWPSMSMAWNHKYMHARRDTYTQTHFSQNCQINLYNTKKTIQFCSLSQVLRNLKQTEVFSMHPRGAVTAEKVGFPGAVCSHFTPHAGKYSLPLAKPPAL